MRKIREVLRLKHEAGLSDRQIARSIGSSRSTVQECLRRVREAGIGWPLPAEVDEAALIARLYRQVVPLTSVITPDFAAVHAELGLRGVTRLLLWQEYRAANPEGLQYTAFCNGYRRWRSTQELVFRAVHTPGDKLFVDYAGQTVPVVDRSTGEAREAQVFVAVLGASNYTYAEASWTQSSADWLGAHVRALEYFGGVPRAVVPDNLKSAVQRALCYEPDLNPAYQELAEHYGLAILPARVRKPRDKAKVEAGVLVVERWILARLRHRTFFSLGELNAAIRELLEHLNARPFKKLEGCRRSRFMELEQPALRPLPAHRYEFATWKKAKVHPDYHVEVERNYYSVPYRLIGQRVDVRLTARMLEVFHLSKLVAVHERGQGRGRFYTLDAHRPAAHVAVIGRTLGRLLERAAQIGPSTHAVLLEQARHRKHPEETLRSAQGIVRLAEDFSSAELERACARALQLRSYSYRTVRTLINAPVPAATQPALDLLHDNVRGPEYFQ
jgi:transposase